MGHHWVYSMDLGFLAVVSRCFDLEGDNVAVLN